MVWAFSLSVEIGESQDLAEQLAAHFDGTALTLSTGLLSHCHASTFQDIDEHWWCKVFPSEISQIGIESPDVAYLMTKIGILLYQRLRTAPSFRYGIVGVEVDEFRTYDELLEDSTRALFPELVISEDI